VTYAFVLVAPAWIAINSVTSEDDAAVDVQSSTAPFFWGARNR
jgi:hypothetical protein